MGIIWPNKEFPGNPQRIMKKTLESVAKNRDGRTIVNRHTFFFLPYKEVVMYLFKEVNV